MKSKAPALAKGLDIIDLIRTNGSLSFNEIQELTFDNPASVNRYLHTLLEKNYLLKNQNQKYELGLKLIDLKDNKGIWPRLLTKCSSFIKQTNEKYGVTVLLLAYTNDTFVAIDKVIALDNLGMMEKHTVSKNDVSSIWSNHYYLPHAADLVKSYFTQNFEHSLAPKSQDLLNSIKEQGYMTYYSNENEIFRVGIPIYFKKQVIASIGIGTFVNQITQNDLNQLIQDILLFAENLSQNL